VCLWRPLSDTSPRARAQRQGGLHPLFLDLIEAILEVLEAGLAKQQWRLRIVQPTAAGASLAITTVARRRKSGLPKTLRIEAIADAAHGQNEFRVGVVPFHLLTQTANVIGSSASAGSGGSQSSGLPANT